MDKIQDVLDIYFNAWNEAFGSKNGNPIRSMMSEDFIGHWAHSTIDKPMKYDVNYDLDQVLIQYDDAEKRFEPISITLRNDENEAIVMGRETNVINGNPHFAQCMLIWRNENNEWKLLREYIELER